MSNYFDMWDGVKSLTPMQVDNMIREIEPAKGVTVVFHGNKYLDVDLLEALRFMSEERRVEDKARQRVVQIFTDNGMILDHRQPNFD